MILVIGYGNPLCGDDGIGPYAVEKLAQGEQDARLRGEVEWLSLRQLTPELAEPISRARAVIFIDAACGKTPGGITCYKLARTVDAPETAGAFTHHVNAEVLLANAKSLYGRRPVAYLYTVTGQNFGLGDSFSPAVESALPRLFERLKARMIRCMNLALLRQ